MILRKALLRLMGMGKINSDYTYNQSLSKMERIRIAPKSVLL